MTWGRLAWLVMLTGAIALAGCGDSGGDEDGGTDGAVDSGRDSGRDTGVMDSGMDAGMDSGTDAGPPSPFDSCDPFTDSPCDEGEKCKVVAELGGDTDAGGRAIDRIFFGCIPAVTEKGEGSPCSRFTDTETEHEDYLSNDCAEGLFCWETEGRSFDTCQPLCDGTRVDCGEGDFCQALNSEPSFGTCTEADDCDPVYQEGCEAGESCYVLGATNGDLLSHCYEFSAPDGGTGAAGEPCMFINNCEPGTQCAPDLLPDGGLSDEVTCHEICEAPVPDGGLPDGGTDAGTDAGMDAGADAGADAGVADAGADAGDDGGTVFTGECPSGDTCVPSEPAEGAMILTPTPPGLCQPEG